MKTGISNKDLAQIREQMLKFATLQVGDSVLAEDLVQESFLSAFNHLEQFKRQAAFKTWVFAILKNKIIDFLRQNLSGPVELGSGSAFRDAQQFRYFLVRFFLENHQVEYCAVTVRELLYHLLYHLRRNRLHFRIIVFVRHVRKPVPVIYETALFLLPEILQRLIYRDSAHPCLQGTIALPCERTY